MARLWRNRQGTEEGKFLVKRRDGSIPKWPWFVLGARDPAAPAALRTYAEAGEGLGFDPAYVADIRQMADEWDAYRAVHGSGDPDGPRHRKDDPRTVREMRRGHSA